MMEKFQFAKLQKNRLVLTNIKKEGETTLENKLFSSSITISNYSPPGIGVRLGPLSRLSKLNTFLI